MGTSERLKSRYAQGASVVVRAREAGSDLEKRLAGREGVRRVARQALPDGVVEYRLHGLSSPEGIAAEVGDALVELKVDEPSLEDVFVALTGEGLTGEERTAEDEE
jgi:hypothetical protein